ncbi:MAG: helix-turn-helix domain-containing protein [Asgard group archaeon]|nr:helix-turn-helix domain-containing protein [Asgard group archaeon]
MSFTDEVIKDLKKFGFTDYQAKIYTHLVSLGVATASEISQVSKVPSNKVYSEIKKLEERGLVLVQESDTSTNRYRPRSPETVIKDLRNEYENSLDSIEDKLQVLHERTKKTYVPEMWILRGQQAVFSKIKEMLQAAKKTVCIGIDTPFDLHLYGIDQLIREKSDELEEIYILSGKEGIDNPGEVKVLEDLMNFVQIGISDDFHAIWVIIDSKEILQGAYAQLEGGIELGIMATWSDNKSFAELWDRFSDSLWANSELFAKYLKKK